MASALRLRVKRSASGGGAAALFEADFSQTTLSAMGFTNNSADDTTYTRATRSIVTAGGPDGVKNCIRWVHNPKTEAQLEPGNPQGYWGGIGKSAAWTLPVAGDSLFWHFYVRLQACSQVDNWVDDGGLTVIPNDFRQKTMDIGNGATGSARFIMYSAYGQAQGLGADNSWRWSMSVGTAGQGVGVRPTVTDGWVAIVMQTTSNTSSQAGNGIFRIAMNNDSTWDQSNTAVNIDAQEGGNGWDSVSFHSFNDATVGNVSGTGPSLTIELGGYKVASARDTSWYANML